MFPYFNLGSEIIYTYPLFLGLLTGLSYSYCGKLIKLKNVQFPNFNLYYVGTFFSAWMGAKILYLLTISPEVQARAILNQNFWLGGGFVFYGGFILGAIFTFFYARFKQIPLRSLEFLVPVVLLTHAIGRIGCFLAGCCFGEKTEFFWSIHMHGADRHPVQLLESITLFILFFWILKRYKADKSVFIPYLFFYAVIRFLLEFLRGDEVRGVYSGGLSTSQFVSIGLLLVFSLSSFANIKRGEVE